MEANITYMYMYRKFAILSNRQKMGHFGKSGISAIFLEQTSDLHHSTKKTEYEYVGILWPSIYPTQWGQNYVSPL